MATIFDDNVTVPVNATEVFTEWAAVGSATSVTVDIVDRNHQQSDVWVQWTDDPDGPEQEPQDVLNQLPPTDSWWHLRAEDLTPEGTYVRLKAAPADGVVVFHATITTA